MYLLGRPEQLEPIYERLRQIGVTNPTAAEETVEKITGQPPRSRQWSYRERRKELLLALLNQHADDLDSAIDELGRQLDHLRQVGIRGFIAEHANDDDYAQPATEQPGGHRSTRRQSGPCVTRRHKEEGDQEEDSREGTMTSGASASVFTVQPLPCLRMRQQRANCISQRSIYLAELAGVVLGGNRRIVARAIATWTGEKPRSCAYVSMNLRRS